MPDISMRFGRDVLVIEGGMGAVLERYGFGNERHPEMLNLTEPDIIEEIHRYFQMAGADCAVSNTFDASADRLSSTGYEKDAATLCVEGVRLAKANHPQHVLANIGPTTVQAGPEGSGRYDEAFEIYETHARGLAAGDPDAIFIQTMTRIDDALCALRAAKKAADLPVIVSCVFDASGTMPGSGTGYAEAAELLQSAGAAAIGANCLLDPQEMLAFAPRLVNATDLPVLAMPDVAHPIEREGKPPVYQGSPDLMAEVAFRLREAGVQLIGSCCGSTPAYTGSIFAAVGRTDVVKPPSR